MGIISGTNPKEGGKRTSRTILGITTQSSDSTRVDSGAIVANTLLESIDAIVCRYQGGSGDK
jgi:hypothetical protein